MNNNDDYALGQTKWFTKVIFAWEDEKEEAWLEEMARAGWMLKMVGFFRYQFEKSSPSDVIYRLDYKNSLEKDYAEYQQIFKDAGWELVLTYANWHYYRIDADNAAVPEIFNSNRSKIEKYRRLLVGAFTPILFMLPLGMTYIHNLTEYDKSGVRQGFVFAMGVVYAVFIGFLLYAFIRLMIKIRSLEGKIKE